MPNYSTSRLLDLIELAAAQYAALIQAEVDELVAALEPLARTLVATQDLG